MKCVFVWTEVVSVSFECVFLMRTLSAALRPSDPWKLCHDGAAVCVLSASRQASGEEEGGGRTRRG